MKEPGIDGGGSADPNGESLFDQLNRTGVKCIVGTGRSGKTATVHYLMENYFQDRRKVMFKVPEPIMEFLPKDYGRAMDLEEIEKDDVVFIDDAALFMSSRSWSSKANRKFTMALTIISHWNVVMIIAIQNMRLLDVLASATQDFMLLQKYGAWANVTLERDEYKRQLVLGQLVLQNEIRKTMESKLNVDVRNYLMNHNDWKLYKTTLPTYWCNQLSIPYADYRFKGWGGKDNAE